MLPQSPFEITSVPMALVEPEFNAASFLLFEP
jgi:hypothetical protein